MASCDWLLYFSMFSGFIHVIGLTGISFLFLSFLWSNNVPLYNINISYLSVHPLMDLWIISAFCLLWKINILLQLSVWAHFHFSWVHTYLWGRVVALCLVIEELLDSFPKELRCFKVPPALCERSDLSRSLLVLIFLWLFDFSHPGGCEVVSWCGFGVHFPSD